MSFWGNSSHSGTAAPLLKRIQLGIVGCIGQVPDRRGLLWVNVPILLQVSHWLEKAADAALQG